MPVGGLLSSIPLRSPLHGWCCRALGLSSWSRLLRVLWNPDDAQRVFISFFVPLQHPPVPAMSGCLSVSCVGAARPRAHSLLVLPTPGFD